MRAVRRANDNGVREVICGLRAFRRRRAKKHVAEHGNEREPSDGTSMFAKRVHVCSLAGNWIAINIWRDAYTELPRLH